uniref:Uncharacterized protein n=1 Tax=Magallana gigas TaxID=29159 RepID=K1R7G4_MAGGI
MVSEIYSSIVSETLEACHGSNFYVDILLDATTKEINVNIPSLYQNNIILTCSIPFDKKPNCLPVPIVQYKFNQTSKILTFYMKYHNKEHAEKALFVNSTLRNGTTHKADFKAKAAHNNTYVTVTCENRSFNQSSGLANGIQMTTEHDPKIKYSCGMDETSWNNWLKIDRMFETVSHISLSPLLPLQPPIQDTDL